MLNITSSRIKKALLNPKAALLYLRNYLSGEILRWKLKFQKNRVIPKLRPNPNFVFFTDVPEFIKEISEQDFIIPTANKLSNNEFSFLGAPSTILKPLIWNKDIKSGYQWPNDFYLDLRENLVKDYDKGRDIKMVWELSRFHFLVPLALAFYKTGEEKYLQKWQEFIEDWMLNNPVYYGPNWMNAMEVAIRAANWIFSWEIIRKKLRKLKKIKLEKEFQERFFAFLFNHGKFIYSNLEYAPIRSNHYLSDLAGLIYLGLFFLPYSEGKKWLKKGISGLEEEMYYQVYEDGVDYELSIPYHRYVTELFLWSAWLYRLNANPNRLQIRLKLLFWKRLAKMVKFVVAYTKPNRLAPQIGDSDDSRFHLVWEDYYLWERRNHSAVIKLYNYVFKEEKTALENGGGKSISFPRAGIYILKDIPPCQKTKEGFYLISGRNKACYGRGGSHTHCDVLSFELFWGTEDIIIDPGTFVYTSNLRARNKFRGTRAHNTVLIDNQEQDKFGLDPFTVEQLTQLKVISWKEDNEKIIFCAQHNGYQRLNSSIIHQREFQYWRKQKLLVIKDTFKGTGEHLIEWNFHLAPQIKVWLKNRSSGEKREIILLGRKNQWLFSVPGTLDCVIIEDEVSPSYGVKTTAKTIRCSTFIERAREFEFGIKLITK